MTPPEDDPLIRRTVRRRTTVPAARRGARLRAALRAGLRPDRVLAVGMPLVAAAGVVAIVLLTAAHSIWPGLIAVVAAPVVVTFYVVTSRRGGRLIGELGAEVAELRSQAARFRLLVQNSYDVVTISRADGTITYMSGGSQRMFGRTPGQRQGANILEFIHPDDQERVAGYFDEVARTPDAFVLYQCRFRHADGSWRWIEILSTNLLHEPSVRGIVCNTRDITENRELQDRLSHDASHDVLTGLANRALFADRVAAATGRAQPGATTSVVLVDLDDFKTVNDTLGHAAGDALLVQVAERMRHELRPGDVVARLGGDEFALLLTTSQPADVDRLLGRVRERLRRPADIDGRPIAAQASFGIAEAQPGDTAGELLRRADVAMYEAKARGNGDWHRYTDGLEARGAERARVTAELRRALDAGELRLHYQPVVGLPDGDLLGVEALVRWQHPERGLLGPADFIPYAEGSGLIVPLGRWVLREACRQAALWLRAHGDRAPRTVSVNVSARQLHEPGLAAEIADALRDHGLPAHRLVVEITESTAVEGEAAWATVARIRELGVRVSLDDFGTGQSTLTMLAHCQVDQIKLDRSFAPVPGPDTIATAVAQVARALGIETVAEGVETPAQAQRLHALGFARAQGFHFAHPMPAADIDAALDDPAVLAATA
ncbi:putative bifunctional diguanylate cyclase/phosphodiesterase [Spirilliplanes yamanashiensis]|uniref:Two-component system response regulator n=1 Tax=Spirilliplanes yamanashiensis TaxID=42233 RepID=A0A8J3YCU8_9ACTN|nr:EAL domain-containing protein [Spirilliplanes yamanashiensis]MDP9818923.1 diguanylate cyclase (GGDEF)-like protein/PAS domain S-box-containing protein [Spirilliplanes yamanashiensis]GIJ05378.1 two-component system response regulator [Spirilliplanes yamanashiensis]